VVEEGLSAKERAFGLYTYLFYIRQLYLGEIDEQWIAHLKNIEHLRTGIGLVGYATRNPKNEYKLRGFNLFKEMWENIEHTVLGRVLQMRLTEEERQAAEEGADYETAVTRANQGSADPRRRVGSKAGNLSAEQLRGLQEAARAAMEKISAAGLASGQSAAASAAEEPVMPVKRKVQKVGKNDPCPCGSGKLYRRCHGKDAAA
jgi:preprotein translocase subunit SecA